MKSSIIKLSLLLACVVNVNAQIKISNFGNYTLKNGEVLQNTRIGYQTYGKLNANRDNTILFATWYAGTGEDLKPYIGRESMLDTTKYHVVVVEALGNGVSSSPTNTSVEILNAGESQLPQLLQEHRHQPERVRAAHTGQHWRIPDDGQHLGTHLHDDLVGVTVRHHTGQGTASRHAVST